MVSQSWVISFKPQDTVKRECLIVTIQVKAGEQLKAPRSTRRHFEWHHQQTIKNKTGNRGINYWILIWRQTNTRPWHWFAQWSTACFVSFLMPNSGFSANEVIEPREFTEYVRGSNNARSSSLYTEVLGSARSAKNPWMSFLSICLIVPKCIWHPSDHTFGS